MKTSIFKTGLKPKSKLQKLASSGTTMQHSGSSPQHFCLRWNNYQSNLTNVFDQLLQSESFVDVTLACDGHSVKAHKMVLSACSPYFQSLFFENPCQHPIVIMRDIKWPELKAAVEFMYKGEINVSQEQIGPLLKVAESLKIRGLADVNGEHDALAANEIPIKSWEQQPAAKKRRRNSRSSQSSCRSSPTGESEALSPVPPPPPTPQPTPPVPQSPVAPPPPPITPTVSVCSERSTPHYTQQQSPVAAAVAAAAAAAQQQQQHQNVSALQEQMLMSLPPPPQMTPHEQLSRGLVGGGGMHNVAHPDDMEIKPGIAEMIREEERARLIESSNAWLGASTSSIAADSYQYQLQSMWQKCWNTNQSLVHNLRFRERGPLKSWRPETMAEAIFSVLKEGLSLSQAARKYDIPYPTFVLYANRVHNMLGPSADGGADLRPKGRGRPQRILLGVWPDEHIRGVIRAVVFRDSHQAIKEEAQLAAAYPRLHDGLSIHNYGAPLSCGSNGGPDPSVSPGTAAAAAVAAVAQGLRQQMCSMVAAASQHHQGFMPLRGSPTDSAHDLRISPIASPLDTPLASPLPMEPALNLATLGSSVEVGIGLSGYKPPRGYSASPRSENLFRDEIEDLVKSPLQLTSPRMTSLSEPKENSVVSIKMEPLAECRSE